MLSAAVKCYYQAIAISPKIFNYCTRNKASTMFLQCRCTTSKASKNVEVRPRGSRWLSEYWYMERASVRRNYYMSTNSVYEASMPLLFAKYLLRLTYTVDLNDKSVEKLTTATVNQLSSPVHLFVGTVKHHCSQWNCIICCYAIFANVRSILTHGPYGLLRP